MGGTSEKDRHSEKGTTFGHPGTISRGNLRRNEPWTLVQKINTGTCSSLEQSRVQVKRSSLGQDSHRPNKSSRQRGVKEGSEQLQVRFKLPIQLLNQTITAGQAPVGSSGERRYKWCVSWSRTTESRRSSVSGGRLVVSQPVYMTTTGVGEARST